LEYSLEKSTSETTDFSLVCSTDSTGTSCTETETFPLATTYYYRVAARNSIGWSSSYSLNLQIITDDYPGSSVTVTADAIEPTSMTISWTSLADADNGGDPIIFYAVELYDAGTDTWNQLNFDFGNLYTTYTHTSASNFQASTQFFFRVRPKNSIGYSQTASTDVELLSDGVPNGMTAPYAGAVTPTSIEVKWDSLTDPNLNGGDEPIFYELEWEDKETDPNNPSWVTLVIDGDGLMLSFIH